MLNVISLLEVSEEHLDDVVGGAHMSPCPCFGGR